MSDINYKEVDGKKLLFTCSARTICVLVIQCFLYLQERNVCNINILAVCPVQLDFGEKLLANESKNLVLQLCEFQHYQEEHTNYKHTLISILNGKAQQAWYRCFIWTSLLLQELEQPYVQCNLFHFIHTLQFFIYSLPFET